VFLSDISIRRPIAMGCLIIALALMGLKSAREMGLENLPKMDAPFVTITTVYPGASPEEIETDVAKRIEDAVVSIDGLKHVSSSCMENVCQTMLEFNMDVDVDIAATDVREQVDLVRSDFPEDVEDPIILKFDINAKPIITMALTGDVPVDELYDYADNELKDRLTTISGVAEVRLVGGAKREVHVLCDRRKLEARGLTSLDVHQAVANGVRTIPSGRLRDSGDEYTVKFDADFDTISAIGDLEIANENAQRCRIRDIGRSEMATEELRQSATINARDCISIRVVKKADANAVAVTEKIRKIMGELSEELPGGMELIWITDDARFIEATLHSAWSDVAVGIALTAAILFLFLYNLRSLFVVSITMPLTIVIALFFMDIAGYTLNSATLIAIGMSVGILVTNSIVVLEAIIKRLNATGHPKEAARLGAKETFVAVLASAGTNVVVLFPLSMLEGKMGMFITPLAVTMLLMTVVSLFISFTLTPMLCSLLLKPRRPDRRTILNRVEDAWNAGFDRAINAYRTVLGFTEKHRIAGIAIVLIVAGILVHSLGLIGDIGTDLVANSDRGEIYVKVEYPTRYSLAETRRRLREIEKRLEGLPDLRHSLAVIGKVEGVIGQSSEGVYLAQILLKFSQRDERTLTIYDLMNDVRSRLNGYPEAITTVTVPSTIGGQNTDIELEIDGKSLEVLDGLGLRTQTLANDIHGLKDVDTSVRTGKPELRIRPNRPVLGDLGLGAVSLGLALRGNLEGLTAGTFKENDRNYDIVVKFDEREGKDQVARFQLPGVPGKPMLLGTVSHTSEDLAPIQIVRKDKRRVTKLFANLEGGKPMGTAVGELSDSIDDKAQYPPGYRYTFAGMYEVMAEAQEDLSEAMGVAIVLVVLTLAGILESFKQPALILVTLPLALIGVMYALYLAGVSLDIFAIMGCVMMVGIVVNNGILIMDQFNIHIAEGVPRHKAMISAACERFRPIVMITLAAVLGMTPLAISRGIGGELRNGIGVSSVGGIFVSGVLTLLVMPILYDLFTRRGQPSK